MGLTCHSVVDPCLGLLVWRLPKFSPLFLSTRMSKETILSSTLCTELAQLSFHASLLLLSRSMSSSPLEDRWCCFQFARFINVGACRIHSIICVLYLCCQYGNILLNTQRTAGHHLHGWFFIQEAGITHKNRHHTFDTSSFQCNDPTAFDSGNNVFW